jgi:gliding motility-associated-like protein
MNAKSAIVSLMIFASIIAGAQNQQAHIGSGYALSFDGVDDYVDLGNIYDDMKLPLTISAWVKVDSRSLGTIFASQDNSHYYNGFHFFVVHSDVVIEYGDGRGTNTSNFRRGKAGPVQNIFDRWVHVTGIMRDANDMDVYINGINVGGSYRGESQFPMKSLLPLEVAKIGYKSSSGVTYHFQGIMDELRIWDRALSVQEIREQMCKKLEGTEDGLVGYWDFDNTFGNVLIDKSPFHFDGAIHGNPSRVFSGAPVGDESLIRYTDDWNNATLSLVDGSTFINVREVNGNAAGVHLYKVNDFPSQRGGLNSTVVSSPYYGVFIAGVDGDAFCDIDYKIKDNAVCRLYTRTDNSMPRWNKNSPALTQVPGRMEFIPELNETELTVDLGLNDTLCTIPQRILIPLIDTVGFEFLWQDGSTNSTFSISEFGEYWVNVDNGCAFATDTLSIVQAQSRELFVSNVFTPNGDQLNQYFVVDEGLRGSTLTVFDRWGQRVYHSTDYQNNWQGDDLPSGVYFYSLDVGECIQEMKGTLTILR